MIKDIVIPAEKIASRRASMPPAYRRAYDSAMSGDSRKDAIRSMCWHCLGYEDSPANCTCPACPLFPYRPSGRPISGTPLTPEQRAARIRTLSMGKKSSAVGAEGDKA